MKTFKQQLNEAPLDKSVKLEFLNNLKSRVIGHLSQAMIDATDKTAKNPEQTKMLDVYAEHVVEQYLLRRVYQALEDLKYQ